jgi:hypothetical protein
LQPNLNSLAAQTLTADDLIEIGVASIHRLKLVEAARLLTAPSKTALKLMGATSDESSSDPATEASPAPVVMRDLMPMMGMESRIAVLKTHEYHLLCAITNRSASAHGRHQSSRHQVQACCCSSSANDNN